MKLEVFQDPVWLEVGPIPITRTAVTSFVISVILVLLAVFVRAAVRTRPQSLVTELGELAVAWIDDIVQGVVGRSLPWLGTFSGSLFLFIGSCAIAGQLPGVHPPTANLAATSALAVIVFLTVPVAGIALRGPWGYFRHYLRPNPIMLPLHMLSEISRTFALSVRLFGNMLSGSLIVALMVGLAGVLVPMPLMALDLLIGLLQAYIFAVLATVYIGAALRAGEDA